MSLAGLPTDSRMSPLRAGPYCSLAGRFAAAGAEVIVDVDPDAPALLDERGQRLVYRTTQECLRNVLKHSGAHQAEVSLHAEDALVVLEVADDGAGVSEAALDGTTTQGHFGLRLLADLARDLFRGGLRRGG